MMKAIIKGGYDHVRQKLSEIVPLEAPFSVFIASTQVCNFRCFYCTHSQKDKDKINLHAAHMSDQTFDNIVQQLKEFPKIGRILFTGLGEPLANPRIPVMIQKLSEAKITDRIEIVTNGSLLTPDMTDRLLQAGLTYLRISLQGLSAEKYKEISGVNIDFTKFVENIKYFYEKKNTCKLYIKVMDACLDGPEDREKFYKMFGDISDLVFIEHIVQAQPQMMDQYGEQVTSEYTFFGEPAQFRQVCPFAFYTMQIDADGNVFPCPPLGLPMSFSLGNIAQTSLYNIWNGKVLYDLQMQHLNYERCQHEICSKCQNYLCFTPEEDNLDFSAEEIKKKLEERGYV